MSIEFENPLTAGTVLVREQIQSQNYAPGAAGWVIKANGDAEFNSIVIRGGTVVSGTALYYSGTPAAGNLFMSVSASAGTDDFGNAYVQGLGLYKAQGVVTAEDAAGNTAQLYANLPGGGTLAGDPGLAFQPSSGTGDPATVGALDPGTGDFLSLLLTSPSDVSGGTPGTDYSQISLVGPYGGPTEINMSAESVNIGGTSVDDAGVISSYELDVFHSYTPAINGDGAATYSTVSGWYQRIGKMIFFSAYFVANGAGTGASNLGITTPTSIDRTTRWAVATTCEGNTAGNNGSCLSVAFTTGSGAAFDRLRNSTGGNLIGTDITVNSIIAVSGWYREA